MKRYLLFAGDDYYPAGGFEDFIKDFDSIEDAENCLPTLSFDWYQIVDQETGEGTTRRSWF
jgi:hypothetical protein